MQVTYLILTLKLLTRITAAIFVEASCLSRCAVLFTRKSLHDNQPCAYFSAGRLSIYYACACATEEQLAPSPRPELQEDLQTPAGTGPPLLPQGPPSKNKPHLQEWLHSPEPAAAMTESYSKASVYLSTLLEFIHLPLLFKFWNNSEMKMTNQTLDIFVLSK